jgi:hypothetical protein
MSGGGGGSGFGAPTAVNDCEIVEQVALSSPAPAIIPRLKVGTELEVEISQPGRGRSLVAKLNGDIAGSLLPNQLSALLQCMDRGRKYSATVVRLQGGLCEVEIRPK